MNTISLERRARPWVLRMVS